MSIPTVGDFKNNSNSFYNKLNFLDCIGSVDRNHIKIKYLKISGSMFSNYKKYYSIVVMTVD